LREEVCDLPPKIEDLQVEDYNDESSSDNEAPTVVIDSSLDEVQNYREDVPSIIEEKQNPENGLSNI
jgi:hypothetical protein